MSVAIALVIFLVAFIGWVLWFGTGLKRQRPGDQGSGGTLTDERARGHEWDQ